MNSLLAVITAAAIVVPSSAWTVVPTPSPSAMSNLLRGVASVGPDAVWSVGTHTDDTTGHQRALTQHWDGHTWRTVTTPDASAENDTLTAVDGVSPTDLWATGFTTATVYDPGVPVYPAGGHPLLAHGDGTSWSMSELPVTGYLAAVDMVSAHDGWAVGSADGQALVMRWDGSSWTRFPAPAFGGRPAHLTGVSGPWAVGFLGSPSEALVLHWNGFTWNQVPVIADPGVPAALFSVAAVSGKDAWAVGYSWSAGKRIGYALRWNGQDWKQVPVKVTEEGTLLRGVVAVPTGVWAVGYYITGGVDTALIMSFDGDGFVKDPPPGLPQNIAGSAVTAIAATPTGELWATGCAGWDTRVLRRMT